jgi:hypothetical protein
MLVVPITSSPAGATPTPVSSCANPPSTLTTGQVLSSGACLVSPSHEYELIMQADGNLVLYYQSQADPLWDSSTQGHAGAYAVLQTDGNLVIYSQSGVQGVSALWESSTDSQAPNATLVMQDDGNLVIYGTNPGGSPFAAWSTATENLRGYELKTGEVLEPGQYLESQNGQYGLEMGTGGVLVLFRTETGNTQGAYRCPLWSEPAVTGTGPVTYEYDTTNPIGTTSSQNTVAVGAYPYTDGDTTTETPVANSYLTMQTDGNLVMYAVGTGPNDPWASGTTGNPGAYAKLGTDGNFVIYSSGGSALWSSYTSSKGEDRGWALCTGSTLQIGQRIKAVPWYSGNYLTMQSTCNLVLYNSGNSPLWNTNTDIDESKDFTKGSADSTLDGLPDNPADFAGCYAVMQTGGNLALIAPNCPTPSAANGYSGCPAGGQFWSSGVYNPSVLYTQPGSFGPFLAFPTSGGDMDIANAAGYLVASNPVVDNPHAKTGFDIGKEILSYVLMVAGAFL